MEKNFKEKKNWIEPKLSIYSKLNTLTKNPAAAESTSANTFVS